MPITQKQLKEESAGYYDGYGDARKDAEILNFLEQIAKEDNFSWYCNYVDEVGKKGDYGRIVAIYSLYAFTVRYTTPSGSGWCSFLVENPVMYSLVCDVLAPKKKPVEAPVVKMPKRKKESPLKGDLSKHPGYGGSIKQKIA